MRLTIVYSTFIIILGCSPTPQKEDLNYLNGYWEIEEVQFVDGQTKAYTVSTTIDFIKLDGMSGFRKKVQPKLNGFYQTSSDAESFEIIEKDKAFKMVYGRETQQWEEEVISVRENSFSVRNQDKVLYTYKRYKPLNLEP